MRHKRKREDWGLRGFVYWAKPEELPAVVRAEEQRLIGAWNALVTLSWRLYNDRNEKLRQDPEVEVLEQQIKEQNIAVNSAWEDFKDAKMRHQSVEEAKFLKDQACAALWALEKQRKEARKRAAKALGIVGESPAEIDALIRDTLARFGLSPSDNRDGEEIRNRFLNARKKWLSGKGGPLQGKEETDPVSFTIRYSGGGLPVPQFLASKGKRFAFHGEADEKGRTSFSWGFGETIVQFRTILHRPLPADGIVKSVRLKHQEGGKWGLVIQVEEPPRAPLPHGKGIIEIHPGWMAWGIKGKDAEGKEKYIKYGIDIGQIRYRSDSGSEVGQECTIKLFESDHSLFGRPLPTYDLYERLKYTDELQELAQADKAQYVRHMREKRNIQRRITKYISWFHWNLAKMIAQKAEKVIWHKVDLAALGRKKDIETLPEEFAARIRRSKSMASHGYLLQKLKQQCAKHAVELVEQE